MDILDISITAHRKKGEHRKSGIGYNHNPKWEEPENFNPMINMRNHAKHVQMIYREAEKGTKHY